MEAGRKFDGHMVGNNYADTEIDPIFSSFQEMRKFMQEGLSPSPTPKEFEHVVLDADDTIWEIEPWGMASMASPVGRTEKNTLPVRLNIDEIVGYPEYWKQIVPTGSVKLAPKLRDTLDKLHAKGIPVSIASNNKKESIEKYLDAFGLRDKFTDIEASYGQPKDQMIRDIAKRNNVESEKILFVDDDFTNAMDVALFTNATSLVVGYNIQDIDEILELIK
jgi:HAD superfamily phosphatase (TIGR01681 family)